MGNNEQTPTTEWNFTFDQVAEAANQVADDILDAVEAGDTGLRDAMNLMVNALGDYLTNPQQRDLRTVVERGYEATFDEVLDWFSECA
jgi:hypothetical protein